MISTYNNIYPNYQCYKSKTVESTATFDLVNKSSAYVHASDFMLICLMLISRVPTCCIGSSHLHKMHDIHSKKVSISYTE